MKHDWEYKKVGNICDIKTGKLDANAADENGTYPFFTCSKETLRINTFAFDCECVLIAGNGELNAKYYKGKFNAYQRTYVITLKNNVRDVDVRYLYLFFSLYIEHLRNVSIGGVIKYIKLGDLTEATIPVPPLPTQQSIVSELDSLSKIIADCKETLKDYDALEQSIFYDMFGDPVKNEKGWNVKKLGEVCTFKNGVNFSKNDKGKQYKFVGVSDFLDKKELHARDLDSVLIEETVSSEYYLNEGDIVFVRSNGSKSLVGRNVLVHTEDEIVLFSGFCIRARIHDENMTPLFLLHTLKADSVKCLISNSGRGCNISNLNQKILDSINVIIPSLSLQNQFIGKISAIEQMKAETKKALQEAET